MKDEVMEEGIAVVAVQTTQDETKELSCGSISYHRYNGPNHFTKD